jgi:hypothetical protein
LVASAADGGAGPQHRGLIILCPSADYVERAWDDARHVYTPEDLEVEFGLTGVWGLAGMNAAREILADAKR